MTQELAVQFPTLINDLSRMHCSAATVELTVSLVRLLNRLAFCRPSGGVTRAEPSVATRAFPGITIKIERLICLGAFAAWVFVSGCCFGCVKSQSLRSARGLRVNCRFGCDRLVVGCG